MLQGEHSAILLTFIKLPFVIKNFVLSIFEWQLKTGFTVYYFSRSLLLQTRPHRATVASSIADPGVVSLIPASSHTFVEIDCEMFSTVIFLLPLIQERLLLVTSKS